MHGAGRQGGAHTGQSGGVEPDSEMVVVARGGQGGGRSKGEGHAWGDRVRRRDDDGREEGEVRVCCADPMAVIVCTNLKHCNWKWVSQNISEDV